MQGIRILSSHQNSNLSYGRVLGAGQWAGGLLIFSGLSRFAPLCGRASAALCFTGPSESMLAEWLQLDMEEVNVYGYCISLDFQINFLMIYSKTMNSTRIQRWIICRRWSPK